MENNLKICSACLKTKPLNEKYFYRREDTSTKDGFHTICIQCKKEGNKSQLKKLRIKIENHLDNG